MKTLCWIIQSFGVNENVQQNETHKTISLRWSIKEKDDKEETMNKQNNKIKIKNYSAQINGSSSRSSKWYEKKRRK